MFLMIIYVEKLTLKHFIQCYFCPVQLSYFVLKEAKKSKKKKDNKIRLTLALNHSVGV